MPVILEAGSPASLLLVRFSGTLTPGEAAEDLARISEESAGYSALLADWREAEIALSTIEFMALTDDWFRMPGARLKAAHVFHAERHKDQAMLFQTKGFLVGGQFRVFAEYGEARSWLDAWTGPRA
ncbi:MAG: hypothetical protein VX529_03630 [Pseudomonadota bacterium]|jgi:hypothetical protein|nr:hypothetical protein [Pseudomonadota bacterium]